MKGAAALTGDIQRGVCAAVYSDDTTRQRHGAEIRGSIGRTCARVAVRSGSFIFQAARYTEGISLGSSEIITLGTSARRSVSR